MSYFRRLLSKRAQQTRPGRRNGSRVWWFQRVADAACALSSVLNFFRRREAIEAELDAELQEFYQTMVERSIQKGMSEQDARRLARLKFGGTEQVKERVRETRGGFKLDSLLRDTRHAFRTIRKAPVFGFVTVTALGVGIGANATIFAIVNRFVLQTPPVRDPSTLISLHTLNKGQCCNNFSWPQYTDVRDEKRDPGPTTNTPRVTCSIRSAIPTPWSLPSSSVRRMRRSRVPCRISEGPATRR